MLGCLLPLIQTASYKSTKPFRFYDDRGRCWTCDADGDCGPCNVITPPRRPGRNAIPPTWSDTCPVPLENDCSQHPGVRFPSLDLSYVSHLLNCFKRTIIIMYKLNFTVGGMNVQLEVAKESQQVVRNVTRSSIQFLESALNHG